MPHNEKVAVSGVIEDVFAHRFTMRSAEAVELADLGPKGLAAFPIATGLAVNIEGERRPSEIKVMRISAEGRSPVEIEHKKPNHMPGHKHPDVLADPNVVRNAARTAGFATIGEPRQRPKHFEVLARRGENEPVELHVDFAGTIYKEKAADLTKWSATA